MKAELPFNKNVATRLLASQGLQATADNLALLASKAKDTQPANKRLSEAELSAAMPKFLRAIHRPDVTPQTPIKAALEAAPDALKRYRLRLADLSGDHRADYLAIDPAPKKTQRSGIAKTRLAARSATPRETVIGQTRLGGPTLQFKGPDGQLLNYRDASWVKGTFKDMLATRPDANERLAELKAAGYDINKRRDFLSFNTTGNADPVLIGLRGPGDKADPTQKPTTAERRSASPGFGRFPGGGSSNLPHKSELGLVILCTDVQVVQFGEASIITVKKPVIYVYPDKKTEVKVHVAPNGEFSAQYPATQNGTWQMIATPDGTLFDPKTEKKYSYLFWEAKNPGSLAIDTKQAFCVKRDDVETFLEGVSRKFALNDRERTDFVSFWIPALQANKWSVVQFLDEAECASYAKLTIEPKPDAEIRLFMLFEGSDKPVATGNPVLPELRRGKYTVVEWGGANLDE